jgi:nucleotide-binding universal stress UspA family protein
MYDIKKILLGIDGSEGSFKAASLATDLASRLGAKITLMYVATDKSTVRFSAKPTYTAGENILVGDKFDQPRKIMEERGVQYDTVVELGDPADMIVETADKGYDIVVVGTRGLSGFQEMVLGSVSQKIVQRSRVPVLIVP